MKTINWKVLILNLILPLAAGGIASLLTSTSMQQYQNLYKPPLAPPGYLFPIVWTILFLLMGIAAYFVTISEAPNKKYALTLYGIQLVANVIWSIIFFNFNAYLVAFTWLLLLWFLIFLTWQEFRSISSTAGKLLVPYLAWVTFAGYLNLAIAINDILYG